MIRHRIFGVNVSKEEAWINQYIEQDYRLAKVKMFTCRYEFIKCTENSTGIQKVKIDFRTFKNRRDFNDYLAMFEDSGWRHISGTLTSGVQYFEKSGEHAADDIFSDRASKTERYKRIANMWLCLFAAYIPIVVALNTTGAMDIHRIFHLKELYYTPGLWEKSGFDFWRAFMFETPFAMGRGFFGILFLCTALCCAYFGFKALYWYNKENKERQSEK